MKKFTDRFQKLASDVQSKVAQNPKLDQAMTGAYNTGSSMWSGAMKFAKDVTQGHGSLKATFANIRNAPIPRSGHSLAVVKGRAYIFGGEEEDGQLANNDMFMVILPSGGVLEADYTNIEARAKTLREGAALDASTAIPSSRKGHTAVVVGDNIYIHGGEDEKGQAVDREYPGRIWVFDTSIKAWSALDPAPGVANAAAPTPRTLHSAASSEYPEPKVRQNVQDPLPQQPPDPAKTVPEVPEKDSWGTIVISAGRSTLDSSLLNDAWAFDIRTRTWTVLPTPPAPARTGSSLAIAANTLFRFGGHDGSQHLGGVIETLTLTPILYGTSASTSTTPFAWHSAPYVNGLGPRERSHAALTAINVGQGRSYLLLLGGQTSASNNSPVAYFDDVWTYTLPAAPNSAAGLKDLTYGQISSRVRSVSNAKDAGAAPGTGEAQKENHGAWAEVRYFYIDKEGDVQPGGRTVEGGKGMGSRGGFAAARATEEHGSSVVVWGGRGPVTGGVKGNVLSDGWLISVER